MYNIECATKTQQMYFGVYRTNPINEENPDFSGYSTLHFIFHSYNTICIHKKYVFNYSAMLPSSTNSYPRASATFLFVIFPA